ncbi:DUF484 family protein [Vibrio profundum]|uniref:DUF484 family protein n=1 Tax=Vibrio profundum TaxID=2910247 RepID=UPI003D132540
MSHIEADQLSAEIVSAYLQDNPDFFLSRSELVDQLSLPCDEQGAVSLVHIQLTRQRHRIEALEEEITGLMSLAANNDKTFYEFMDLQEKMLKCETTREVITAIEAKARELNLTAYVRLIESDSLIHGLPLSHYQRFSNQHLAGKSAFLGRLRKSDRQLILGEGVSVADLGSCVVLPLISKRPLGVLSFVSEDGGHFQPHMDTLFLRHLALVFTHLVQVLPWNIAKGEYDTYTSRSS